MEVDMRQLLSLVVVLTALAGAGCDRRTEAWVPLEEEPPAPARPVRIPSLTQTRMDQRAIAAALGAESPEEPMPQGQPTPGGPAAAPEDAASNQPIRGTIRLADGARAPDQGVLFVIARVPGMRPPLAAVKLAVGPFPQSFSIGPENRAPMMGANVPFAGPIELTARIDIDGDPMTRSPGELSGSGGQVQPGAVGIEIVLSEGGN
jgi:hypothetical protein